MWIWVIILTFSASKTETVCVDREYWKMLLENHRKKGHAIQELESYEH
jgi:hypothetical protein